MSEKLKKENKELKEKLDFLTNEMKEIKETLKLVSSKERETKKILDNNNFNRSPEETAKFVESALKANCNDNNLLHELTKDYLIEIVADMRVGQLVFQKIVGINRGTQDNKLEYLKDIDGLDKTNPFYRTWVLRRINFNKFWTSEMFNKKLIPYLLRFTFKDLDIERALTRWVFDNYNYSSLEGNGPGRGGYRRFYTASMGLPRNNYYNDTSDDSNRVTLKEIFFGVNPRLNIKDAESVVRPLRCDYRDEYGITIFQSINNTGVWRICY